MNIDAMSHDCQRSRSAVTSQIYLAPQLNQSPVNPPPSSRRAAIRSSVMSPVALSHVQREEHLLAGLVASVADRLEEQRERFVTALERRREAVGHLEIHAVDRNVRARVGGTPRRSTVSVSGAKAVRTTRSRSRRCPGSR